MFFQERDFLIKHGHNVIDFSVDDPQNVPSKYSDYFARNVDYMECSKDGKSTSLLGKFRIAVDFIHNRQAVNSLKALIEKEKPDIAHLHNIYHQITPSIIPILKNAGVKVVLTLHDYKLVCPTYSMFKDGFICNKCMGKHFWYATSYKCQDASYLKSLLLSAEAYWHKWTKNYEKVNLFLCPSQFMANMVSQYRVDKQKIRVLHNGIDPKTHNFAGQDDGYAIYFGRISREKGVETLLKAHQSLSNRLPLKIVGTGPLMPKLKEKYPGAEFTGYKTGAELKELLQRASFVALASECYENFSMTVLEAMAFGKPTIGSRVGGIPEQIEDGKTGFLFEMGNVEESARKMTFLAKNRKLRKQMGEAARKKLEREYSLDVHCTKLMEIYKELLL